MELTRFDGHRCFHLCIGPGAHGVAQYAGLGSSQRGAILVIMTTVGHR